MFFFCITGSGVERVGAHQGLLPGEHQHSLITSPAVGSWIREGVRKGGIFYAANGKSARIDEQRSESRVSPRFTVKFDLEYLLEESPGA